MRPAIVRRASRGPLFGRRRRRWVAPTLALALVLGPVFLGNGVELAGGVVQEAPPARPAGVAQAVAAPDLAAPAAFARFEDLELRIPSPQLRLVGYHEAALPQALPLTPVGRLAVNDNPTRFSAPSDDLTGPEYVVLSSRGRSQPATSAADLVMEDGEPVASPVTGTVTDVGPYLLYGAHRDTRIEIAPEDRPDLRVVLIHVTDVRVSVGDDVVAGRTPLAGSANRFPFGSHVDVHIPDGRLPHVHLEVKRSGH